MLIFCFVGIQTRVDVAVPLIERFKGFSGGTLIVVRDENTFKMHGRVYGVHLVCFMFRDKINTVDILFIFTAFDK